MSAASEAAVSAALREVVTRALLAEQQPDTEATIKALREISWAVIRAAETIRTAERDARDAATHKDAA